MSRSPAPPPLPTRNERRVILIILICVRSSLSPREAPDFQTNAYASWCCSGEGDKNRGVSFPPRKYYSNVTDSAPRTW